MEMNSALLKAQTNLILNPKTAFYGYLTMKLIFIEDETIETIATDGVHLFYNSTWVAKQSQAQLVGVLAHEVMHCVANHPTRLFNRVKEVWNIACDYVINWNLHSVGFILPDGGYLDEKYKDDSEDNIYNQLLENNEKVKPCKWGLVLEPPKNAKTTAEQETQWKINVAEAAQLAAGRGELPGDLKQYISEILHPLIDWREVLWPFFTNNITNEYSWRRPNRAYIDADEYFPSLSTKGCAEVAVVIDSSGSTSQHYQQFASELDAVLATVTPTETHVFIGDVTCRSEHHFNSDERLEDLEIVGEGGTHLSPMFKKIDDNHPDVEAIIVLTDLEMASRDFEECEEYSTAPVLWVTTDKHTTAPFGETVYMNPC